MNEDAAKQRFILLNLLRLIALMIVLAGVANISGRLLPDLSPVLGYVLLVVGAIDFFAAPVLLKRAWRDRDG